MNKPKFQKAASVDKLSAIYDEALKRPDTTIVSESGNVTQVTNVSDAAPEEGVEFTNTDDDTPWSSANPRIIGFYQIRMPEPLKLKLEWLYSHQSNLNNGAQKESRHAIALGALTREIDRMIAKAKKTK